MSTAEIALPQIKLRAGRARITICNLFVVHVPARMCCIIIIYFSIIIYFDFTRVYMYRIFSVVVSVAVMLLKNGSVTHLFHTRRVNGLVWLRIFRCRRNLFVSLLEK